MKLPLQIGITGGIGSGKSIVCKVFTKLKVPVYSADDRAKSLMSNDEDLRKQIIKHFGKDSYLADGSLNRRYLSEMVFKDENKVALLNSLVHPAVREDYKKWGTQNANAPYLIREAALMIESGIYKDLDYLINVKAPHELKVKRIKQRDPQRSEEEINNIISKQLSDEVRDEKADFIIDNSGSTLLILQVLDMHNRFLKAQAGSLI